MMNILIIEDEFLIAEELRSLLEELGHNVMGTAATAQSAFEAVVQTQADLAIIDTRLQDETSERAVQACQQRGLPVIISSGHQPAALPEFARSLTVLQKPFGRANVEFSLSEVGQGRSQRA